MEMVFHDHTQGISCGNKIKIVLKIDTHLELRKTIQTVVLYLFFSY